MTLLWRQPPYLQEIDPSILTRAAARRIEILCAIRLEHECIVQYGTALIGDPPSRHQPTNGVRDKDRPVAGTKEDLVQEAEDAPAGIVRDPTMYGSDMQHVAASRHESADHVRTKLARVHHVGTDATDEIRDTVHDTIAQSASVFDRMHVQLALSGGVDERMGSVDLGDERANMELDALRIDVDAGLENRTSRAIHPRRVTQVQDADGLTGGSHVRYNRARRSSDPAIRPCSASFPQPRMDPPAHGWPWG